MATFIIKVKQIRRVDGQIKARDLVINAHDKHQAIRHVLEYCKGYTQYESPYFVDVYLELSDGNVVAVDSLS